MWRIIKKIFYWTSGIILSLVFLTTLLVYIFEDDIKNYAIEKMNSQLNTRVDVEDIELSLWSRFPYASLTFKNVYIPDAYKNTRGTDTLLFAEHIYFDFSLIDLWNENYTVKKVEVNKGVFNMRINELGDGNYNILKPSKDTTASSFDFALEAVVIKDVRYTYNNEVTGQDYDIALHEGNLSGDFSAKKYLMDTKIDAQIHHIRNGQIPILFNQSFLGDVMIDINSIDTSYAIKTSQVELSAIPLDFKGFFSPSIMKISLKGENLNLAEVTNKMQGQYNTDFTEYKGNGIVNFGLEVIKNDSTNQKTIVDAAFTIKNGNLSDPNTNLSLSAINLKGKYHQESDGDNQKLDLYQLGFKTLKGNFEGSLSIENFKLPTIETKMKGTLDLATIHKFFRLNKFAQLNGTVSANLAAKIKFKNIANRPDQFSMVYAKGAFELAQTQFQFVNDSRIWKNINGRFVLSGNDAALQNVTAQIGVSDLQLNGALQNFVPFLQNAGTLTLTSDLKSNRIRIEDFYNSQFQVTEKRDLYRKLLPQNMDIDFTGNIQKLTFAHHPYQNVHGRAVLKNNKLVLDEMRFENSDGKFSGNVVINDQPKANANVSVYLKTTNINIKKLFSEWNNFDQKVVTAQHLSGTLNTNIQMTVPMRRDGVVLYKNLKGTIGLKITDGELVQMPMMKEIGIFLGKNKITKLVLGKNIPILKERLNHLKFDNLENTIQIDQEKIIMPEMRIGSNLISLNVSAEHAFNNDIDYHFDFRFKDLKIQQETSEFGTIKDDGTGVQLHFRMYGNTANPQFSLDKDKRKETRQEKFEEEKQTVKSILKEEFNLFRNDTSVKGMDQTPKEKEVDLEFYGEGFENEKEEVKPEKDNKTKANKFFQKLKKEQETEKKDEEQEFEIDL